MTRTSSLESLLQRLLHSFHRALYVCLDDDGQFLHLALGDLGEQVIQGYLAVSAELLLLGLLLTLLYQFLGKALVLDCVEGIAARREPRPDR